MARARRATSLVLAAALVAAAAADAAQSPPSVTARAGGKSREAHLWSYTWHHPTRDGCVGIAADGLPRYGDPLPARSGRVRVSVRFHTRNRPIEIHVGGSDRRDGDFDRLRSRLRRVNRDGDTRAWVARFVVPASRARRSRERERYFVDVFTRWRVRNRCGGVNDASWSFGLKRSR